MPAPEKVPAEFADLAEWFIQLRNSMPPEIQFAGLSTAEILAGLKPEERIAGLKPEERIAGLKPEDLVLGLPDDALRALPESYLATLSEDAQRRIRARRAPSED